MSCHICAYPSVLKCRQCGKSVCGRHYDYSDGKCTVCHEAQYPKPEAPKAVETKPAAAPVVKPMLPKARKGKK